MIAAEDLVIRAGHKRLVDGISLTIPPGLVTAIIGPNGAGKSTLLKALTGEIKPASGRVTIDGTDLRRLPLGQLAARRAVLPQASSLAFPFTVHEVVRLGAFDRRGAGAINARVVAALARVDLDGFGGRLYQELSGGEQQRVHLARVLCQLPDPRPDGRSAFLFLDEPTASLDLRHQLMTLSAARDFASGGGGVVAVLHDMNLAALHADRIVVVHRGQIAAEGTPADVLTDALLAEVFGVTLPVGKTAAGVPFILPQAATAA
ncbi:iron complex transport system ATP-binding protein [Kaistia soli DSM 19436]|uniref:Iron complex transport system ATP-binding protein n=1 Tax=Kaistia soli DSM 19436 TaxID=1122133 RepID=A0A1M5DS58_9HYPH|nr:heme ABC transporter ATP-binding protein [Kaistia soli]SHF69612.1 iron complex transport system ATP-binding protein [Kaistia soli DSM 19436]